MFVNERFVDLQMSQAAVGSRQPHNIVEGIHQLAARPIIQRQGKQHATVAGSFLARPSHALLYFLRQLMLSSDVIEADIVPHHGRHLLLQVLPQQAHEEASLRFWPALPVFHGERVQRKRWQTDARAGFHHLAHGGDAGAVPGDARQMPAPRPAPVAIHDDGNVPRQTLRIEPAVNLEVFAIQSGGNGDRQDAILYVIK